MFPHDSLGKKACSSFNCFESGNGYFSSRMNLLTPVHLSRGTCLHLLSVVLWYILGWGNCGVVSSPYLLYLAGCKTVTIFTSTNFHRMNEILHASSHCEPLETGYSLWCLASVFTTYIITLFVQWLHTEMTNSSTCSGLPFLSGTWLALFVCVCCRL